MFGGFSRTGSRGLSVRKTGLGNGELTEDIMKQINNRGSAWVIVCGFSLIEKTLSTKHVISKIRGPDKKTQCGYSKNNT